MFFTTVAKEEELRVIALTADCRSRDAVKDLLGEPDQKFDKVDGFDPIWKQKLNFPASWLYTQLSAIADLRVIFDDDGLILKKIVAARCIRK
jgi:hypothetical protein